MRIRDIPAKDTHLVRQLVPRPGPPSTDLGRQQDRAGLPAILGFLALGPLMIAGLGLHLLMDRPL